MPPVHEEESLDKPNDWRSLRRLLKYLRPYRSKIFLALFLSMISSLAMVAVPWLVAKTIDWYIVPVSGEAVDWRGVWKMAGLFAGLAGIMFCADYVNWMLVSRVGQEAMRDLRMELFRHLQRLSLTYFDRTPVGRIITRITNDVGTLNELLSSGIVGVIQQLLMLVGILVLLFFVNARLLIGAGIVIPFGILAAWNFRHHVRRAYRETRRRLARLNAFIQENITGMRTVQAYTREMRQLDRFARFNDSYREATIQTIFQYALLFPAVEVCSVIAMALVIWKGGGQVLQGMLTLGELTLFLQALDRFFGPIRDLSERYNLVQASIAASERIFEVLDEQPEIPEPKAPKPLVPLREGIQFQDVWMAYRGEHWVLKGISLDVPKGQTVALVGSTGSGKTTLTSLLCRFYEFQRGDIRFDGVSIRDIATAELRRRIALVLQDVFLFYGDVASNIRLGEEGIGDEAMRRAAERVQADVFIQKLPRGYASHVMERGATLSVGQKQLLAFARALAFDPEILILDEATSHIDTETEQLIQKALGELLRNRTALVVAHRLSTIQQADRIVVIHHGHVAEQGTHQQLLARGGLYRNLYDLQYASSKSGSEPAQAASPRVETD